MSDWLKKIKLEQQASEPASQEEEVVNLTIKVRGRKRRNWWVDRGKRSAAGSLTGWMVEKLVEEFGEPPDWY